MSIRVECTWGEGSDIIVIGEGQNFVNLSKEGSVETNPSSKNHWQLDLTIEEANDLIKSLQQEVATAERLRDICKPNGDSPEKGIK
jgi:hypothetical protein